MKVVLAVISLAVFCSIVAAKPVPDEEESSNAFQLIDSLALHAVHKREAAGDMKPQKNLELAQQFLDAMEEHHSLDEEHKKEKRDDEKDKVKAEKNLELAQEFLDAIEGHNDEEHKKEKRDEHKHDKEGHEHKKEKRDEHKHDKEGHEDKKEKRDADKEKKDHGHEHPKDEKEQTLFQEVADLFHFGDDEEKNLVKRDAEKEKPEKPNNERSSLFDVYDLLEFEGEEKNLVKRNVDGEGDKDCNGNTTPAE